jgi:hypothetical protein
MAPWWHASPTAGEGNPAGLRSGGPEREAGRGGVAEVVVHADHLTATAGQQ